jgi:hypothetical protein
MYPVTGFTGYPQSLLRIHHNLLLAPGTFLTSRRASTLVPLSPGAILSRSIKHSVSNVQTPALHTIPTLATTSTRYIQNVDGISNHNIHGTSTMVAIQSIRKYRAYRAKRSKAHNTNRRVPKILDWALPH